MSIHQVMLIFGAVSTLLGLVLLLERNLPRGPGSPDINESLWRWVEGLCSTCGFFAALWVFFQSEELSFVSPDAQQSLRVWLVLASGLMFSVFWGIYEWCREQRTVHE